MSQLSDEELKQMIIRVLENSTYPLKALDIARRVNSANEGVNAARKDVNRVLSKKMRREAEIKSPPGQNPPLWGLVDPSPATSTTPSYLSSPGAAGGCNPPKARSGRSTVNSVLQSPPGTAGGSKPSSSLPSRESESSGRGSIGEELFSKSRGVDGSYIFTPVSGPVNGTQISPQQRSAASGQVLPQEQCGEVLQAGISETQTDYNPDVKLQTTNHTSVGAVNSPVSSGQERKKKKNSKRVIAASFPVTEKNSHQSSGDTHQRSAGSTSHITQETESADDAHVGQEGERPDNEHVTQERLGEDLSLSEERQTENLSSRTFQPPVEQEGERLDNVTQERLAEDFSAMAFQPPVDEQGQR